MDTAGVCVVQCVHVREIVGKMLSLTGRARGLGVESVPVGSQLLWFVQWAGQEGLG